MVHRQPAIRSLRWGPARSFGPKEAPIESDVTTRLATLDLQRGNGPLHKQIYAGMKRLLRTYALEPGTRLPPEEELASLWGVARGTVRRALLELTHEGALERKPRRGTRVASPKIHQYLGDLTSFTEDMRARGFTPGSELISIDRVAPSLQLQQLLGAEVEFVWRMVRRRFADDRPLALETCHVAASRLDRSDLERAGRESLYIVYREAGLIPKRAVQRVEAIVLDGKHAELLEGRVGDPAFKQERITFDGDERVVEVVESVYRGDRYTLQVDLRELG